MIKKNYTLKEIAVLAEVSRGTVDRVIHNRGKVSAEARKKVEQVLDDIDYQPNLIAQSLKSHKNYVIGVLIPNDQEGEYWQQCAHGVRKAEVELRQFGISLLYFRYTSTRNDFEKQLSKAINKGLDAILMVPIYTDSLTHLYDRLEDLQIPIALLNTELTDRKHKIFLGQANTKSGRLAGQLMDYLVKDMDQGTLLVMHLGIKSGHSLHLEEKENGFKAYFAEKYENPKIEVVSSSDDTVITNLPIDLSEVSGIFVTTSKIHLLSNLLKQYPKIKTIGYDLIPKNIENLKKGKIDILLNQKPEAQAYRGITALSDHLLYNKDIPNRKLFPVDIVVSENVDEFI